MSFLDLRTEGEEEKDPERYTPSQRGKKGFSESGLPGAVAEGCSPETSCIREDSTVNLAFNS